MGCVTEVRVPAQHGYNINRDLLEGLWYMSHHQPCWPDPQLVNWQVKGLPQGQFYHLEAKGFGEERFLELLCRVIEMDLPVYIRYEGSDHFTQRMCKPAAPFKSEMGGVRYE